MMSASPSSSSTSSTLIAFRSPGSAIGVLLVRVGRPGQREAEPGALAGRRVEPDPPAEVLDDLPAHGQSDAGARVAAVVEALEKHEYALGVLRVDPQAVVGEREQPEGILPAGRDDDARRPLARELQRVAEQVLEHR